MAMILIVDDKPENLFSLKKLLQLHAFDVDTADSGEESLKKILKTDYSLIILDVQMPGMDGFEVAETISGFSRSKDIPIIFLSAASTEKRFIAKGYASGGIDYITKPFDPDLLLLKVKTLCRLSEQTKMLNQVQKELENANHQLEQKVKERTAELLLANKNLELSNQELQQYSFLASHDLQEPLRKIHTFSLMVMERFLDGNEEALGFMKRVIASTERMRQLIDDLMGYSQLSGEVNFRSYPLGDILREVMTDLELSIKEKEAIITAGPLPELEMIPGQMRQVFQNLISNSLKFSSPGIIPVIHITSEYIATPQFNSPAANAGDYCRISCCDNGIGFNEDYLDKIFSLFQRLHGRHQYQGTGIGLAIVKKIVGTHHGQVTAHSKEGKGACFIIILPVRQPSYKK
jgi:signal transduction histidine kinase